MKVFISFLACLLSSFVAANAEATITISANNFFAEKDAEGGFGGDTDRATFNGTTIPTSQTVNVGNQNYHSNNSINWFLNGGQTVFSFDTDQKRPGTFFTFASTTLGAIYFRVSSNEPYQLSGYYNVTDVASSGQVSRFVRLEPIDLSQPLYSNRQISSNIINELFVVGGAGGDSINNSIGSLTGTLITNKYKFSYNMETDARPDADSGASALGSITLKIGTVPEPSTLLLLGIGAISLLGYRKASPNGSANEPHFAA